MKCTKCGHKIIVRTKQEDVCTVCQKTRNTSSYNVNFKTVQVCDLCADAISLQNITHRLNTRN